MSAPLLTAPSPQSGWNLFGAFCGWVGWSLWLLPQLNAAGYSVAWASAAWRWRWVETRKNRVEGLGALA